MPAKSKPAPKSRKADGTEKKRWSAAERKDRGHDPRRRGGQSNPSPRRPDDADRSPVARDSAGRADRPAYQRDDRRPSANREDRRPAPARAERRPATRWDDQPRPAHDDGRRSSFDRNDRRPAFNRDDRRPSYRREDRPAYNRDDRRPSSFDRNDRRPAFNRDDR